MDAAISARTWRLWRLLHAAQVAGGALIGAMGAIAGAFGGYQARVRLVRALHVPDIAIAIPEDLVAIGLGLLLSRF